MMVYQLKQVTDFGDLNRELREIFDNFPQLTLDVNGDPALVGANAVQYPLEPPLYTVAIMPSAAVADISTVIRVSDVGATPFGTLFYTDGTYWRPVGGSFTVAQKAGSVAAPISSKAGGADVAFTHDTIVIPGAILIPGESRIEIEALYRRTGATATGFSRIKLSTDAVPLDAEWVYGGTMPATDQSCRWLTTTVFPRNGSVTTQDWIAPNTAATGNIVDRTSAKFTTLLDQYIAFAVTSGNAADTFQLLSYKVRVFQ